MATYLERDVRPLTNVGSLRNFGRFLRACALRSGNLLNKADLARDVGVAPSTANQWLSVLEASGQVVLLKPWFSNRTKSLVKSPKLYLADSGVLCALLNIGTADELRRSPSAGAVWETFVFAQLRHRERMAGRAHNLFFWGDRRREDEITPGAVVSGHRADECRQVTAVHHAHEERPGTSVVGLGHRPPPFAARRAPGAARSFSILRSMG